MVCNKTKIRVAGAVALLWATVGTSQAVDWNSFHSVTSLSGIGVVWDGSLGFTVSVDPTATMLIGSDTYHITEVFGFYLLNNTNTGTPNLNATGSDFFDPRGNGNPNVWSFEGDGHNWAGWEGNPEHALIPPPIKFNFDSLTVSSISDLGFHFRTLETLSSGLGGGNTAFFKVAPNDDHHGHVSETPEPVTSSLMVAGALAFLRRRVRRKAA